MQTISLETAKRPDFQELVKDMDTEYGYYKFSIDDDRGENITIEEGLCSLEEIKIKYEEQKSLDIKNPGYSEWTKALTLDEAFEILPYHIFNKTKHNLILYKNEFKRYVVSYLGLGKRLGIDDLIIFSSEDKLEAIEKMIIYLLTNGLITNG